MKTKDTINDALGKRMKEYYEGVTQTHLVKRTFTIARLDGKAFHGYTAGLKKPFDVELMEAMSETMQFLCKNISNVKYAYTQSDEISLLLTDFDTTSTQQWFNGNVQKMVSNSASLATSFFLQKRWEQGYKKLAQFDSRVFTIPAQVEVSNYFLWRQLDAVRNSIQAVAQANFSHNELKFKKTNQMQEMIFQKTNVNWNDLEPQYKRGWMCTKQNVEIETTKNEAKKVVRSKWIIEPSERLTPQELQLSKLNQIIETVING